VIAANGKPRSLGLLPTNAGVMLTLPVDLAAVLTSHGIGGDGESRRSGRHAL
jgi:hypothetical protein